MFRLPPALSLASLLVQVSSLQRAGLRIARTGVVVALVALTPACAGAPAIELRRAVLLSDPAGLSPLQHERLGCDPCVELEVDPTLRGRATIVGPERADLEFALSELLVAEVREREGLFGAASVYDLLLQVAPGAQRRLERFRASHPRTRLAISLDGRVIGLTTHATWPERIFVARFRDPERAAQIAARIGLPVESPASGC